MKKLKVLIIGIILLLTITIFIGCTENNDKTEKSVTQNQLPVPAISFPLGDHPRWWNDDLDVSAYNSYDSDGNISNYRWFFELYSGDDFFTDYSRDGRNVSFSIPELTGSPGKGVLTLQITDDDGDTSFTYYEILIRKKPQINFEQVDSSATFNITYVSKEYDNYGILGPASTPAKYPLIKEEIGVKIYEYDSQTVDDSDPWSWVEGPTSLHGYNDVNGDGDVTAGDTFTIPSKYEGRHIKIVLTGAYGHNLLTEIGSLEAEIE